MIFLLRHWKLIGFGVIVAVLLGTAAYYRMDRDHWRKVAQVLRIDLVKARERTEAEIANHAATKRAYAEAQEEAARMEAERLARITAQQKDITDGIAQSYRNRIARLRASVVRSEDGTPADGSAGSEPVSCLPSAPLGTAGCPATLHASERVIAEEQAIQLEELQGWVRRQAGVLAN